MTLPATESQMSIFNHLYRNVDGIPVMDELGFYGHAKNVAGARRLLRRFSIEGKVRLTAVTVTYPNGLGDRVQEAAYWVG